MKTRCVALCCALAVLTAACGSRLSDDELSTAAGTGGGAAVSTDSTGSSGVQEGADGPMLGTLPAPCGEGDAPPGPTPDTEGVSQDTVKIAVISDKAGQVKVPTASIEESAQAFVDWCNGLGGVNGRTLELTKIDSKLFSHLEATKEACNAGVFAIVGSGSVTDNQGAQEMVDCGLVEVPAYTATAAKALSDSMVQPLPNPSDRFNVGPAAFIAEEHPEAVKKAAILGSSIETATVQMDRIMKAYESAGFEWVYTKETGVVQENYATEASEMKAEGVEYVTMISAASELVKLLRDMKTQGFTPEVIDLPQQYYDPEVSSEPAAEGALVQVNTVPFEEAADSPALTAYLDAYDAVDAAGKPDPTSLGVQSFSAGLLFATALKELGDDVTREGLLDQLRTITEWDGGGLHFTSNPGENEVSTCFAYMQIVGGEFVRYSPEETTAFTCDPSYAFDLGDDYGGGATLKGS